MANVLQERLNEMVENIISKIENNETGSWFKSWATCGIPTNFETKSSYNGFNILSLMFEAQRNEYKSNYWLTFNQIRELKATVKKGEKSTPIFFFKPLKIKEENENGEVIDKFKWNGKELAELKFRIIDSARIGKVKQINEHEQISCLG